MNADVPSVLGVDLKFVIGKTCKEGGWAPTNASQPSLLRNSASLYIAVYSRKAAVYQMETDQKPSESSEEVGIFRIRLPLSGRAAPLSQGGTASKTELKIK